MSSSSTRAQSPLVYCVRLLNAGWQFIKANPTDVTTGFGVNNGVVEYCWFGYSIMHADIAPFRPLAECNPMLHSLPTTLLYALCVMAGAVGSGLILHNRPTSTN
jgi:hypothetical protein